MILRLSLLGGALLTDGVATTPLPADRRGCLLALLATEGGWVERDRLALLFWPESDESAAKAALRQLLVRVRRMALEPALEATGDAVRWPVASDVAEFRRALADGDPTRAVALYGGPLLEGFAAHDVGGVDAWFEGERDRLHAAFHGATMRATDAALAAGALRGRRGRPRPAARPRPPRRGRRRRLRARAVRGRPSRRGVAGVRALRRAARGGARPGAARRDRRAPHRRSARRGGRRAHRSRSGGDGWNPPARCDRRGSWAATRSGRRCARRAPPSCCSPASPASASRCCCARRGPTPSSAARSRGSSGCPTTRSPRSSARARSWPTGSGRTARTSPGWCRRWRPVWCPRRSTPRPRAAAWSKRSPASSRPPRRPWRSTICSGPTPRRSRPWATWRAAICRWSARTVPGRSGPTWARPWPRGGPAASSPRSPWVRSRKVACGR